MTINKTFLKEELDVRGLDYADVYRGIGVSKGTFVRWANGHACPSDALKKMDEMGLDIYFIITGKRTGISEQLMEQVLIEVESQLEKNEISISLLHKARLINSAYKDSVELNQLDKKAITKMLTLFK